MPLRLHAVAFCDDVRRELGNKLSLIGLYNEAIVVSAGPGPILLPKLALVWIVAGLKGAASLRLRNQMSFGTPIGDLAGEFVEEARHPANDQQNVVTQLVPALFPTTGRLYAALEVQASGQSGRFEHSIEVRRSDPGAPAN